ncbi:MAG: glycosyltransferase family 87 protein [Bryobacteraceae bacterium]
MKSRPAQPAEALLCVITGALFFGMLGSTLLHHAAHHDFLVFFTQGTIFAEGNVDRLYDIPFVQEVQQRIAPEKQLFIPPTRPAFYVPLLAPLGLMSIWPAFTVWLIVQGLGLLAFTWWTKKRFGWGAVAAMSFFFPFAMGILNGQDISFMVLLVLGSWLAIEKGRDGLAGVLLAGTLFKFHLLMLLAPAMLLQRKWRMFAAYALTGAVEAGISVALAGARPYIDMLTNGKIDTLSESPEMMPNIYAMLMNLGIDSTPARVVGVLAVAALALFPRAVPNLTVGWFWAAAAGSILVTPHTYGYDIALLLPALLMMLQPDSVKPAKWVAVAAMTIVPYVLTVIGPPWTISPSILMLALLLAISGRLPEWGPRREASPQPAPAA